MNSVACAAHTEIVLVVWQGSHCGMDFFQGQGPTSKSLELRFVDWQP